MKQFLSSILIVLLGLSMDLNAQSRLFPSRNSMSDSISNIYHTKVDSLLLNGGVFNVFAFEIRPSFSGETGCYYDVKDSVLVLRTANQNIWYYKGNNRSKKQRKHQKELVVSEYRCPISQEARQSFNRLFTAAVFSSSFLATPFGADGVTYEIRVRGGSYSAECWSPKKDSNCGQLVEFLAHLSEAIKGNDPQMIESLIPLADALSLLFEALYPEDVKENSTLLIWK